MRKALLQKKLELFKTLFPNYLTSKKGSFYHVVEEHKRNRKVAITGNNVTKGILDKIGTIREWEEKQQSLILITPSGRMLLKMMGKNAGYRLITPSIISKLQHGRIPFYGISTKAIDGEEPDVTKIARVFFIGKKYEWLFNYPSLWRYKYFLSFSSLSAAKTHLGYGFISDSEFVILLSKDSEHTDQLHRFVRASTISPPESREAARVNMVALLKSKDPRVCEVFDDYVKMCLELDKQVQIPRGMNKLNEYHDECVMEIALKDVEKYSEDTYEYTTELFDYWDSLNLTYEILDSPRKMFIEAKRQMHCLASYATDTYLRSNMFVKFTHDGKSYDLMINKDNQVRQFYGYKNCEPPKELKEAVKGFGGQIEGGLKDIKIKPPVDTSVEVKSYALNRVVEVVEEIERRDGIPQIAPVNHPVDVFDEVFN